MAMAAHRDICWGLLCWRWAFLVEIILLTPLYLGLYFIPKEDIQVVVTSNGLSPRGTKQKCFGGSSIRSQNDHQSSSHHSDFDSSTQFASLGPTSSANSSYIHSPPASEDKRKDDIETKKSSEHVSSLGIAISHKQFM